MLFDLRSMIFTIIALSFANGTSAIICDETQCQPGYDHCCKSYFSLHSKCCSFQRGYWAYKGIGIGLGMTVAAVFIYLLYSCWRNRRRREERSSTASNDYSWDVPPDYDSLKHTFDKELPTYHSLYEKSFASLKTNQNLAKQSPERKPPPDYECSCRPSTSRMTCSQISVPKDVLMTVTFDVQTGKEKVNKK